MIAPANIAVLARAISKGLDFSPGDHDEELGRLVETMERLTECDALDAGELAVLESFAEQLRLCQQNPR